MAYFHSCELDHPVELVVAAIDGGTAGAFCADGLASFESLAASQQYAWPIDAFLPNVLLHLDLPELAADSNAPTLILNPLGADKRSLGKQDAAKLYADAMKCDGFELHAGPDDRRIASFVKDALER